MSTDLDVCIETLKNGGLLTEKQIKYFCEQLKQQLLPTPNVVYIQAPVTVVGDIHGQFYDLLELFKIGGECPNVNYLFLGDYVDRGYHSVQTISLLICLRLRYPTRITLLRGNHESRQVTQVYGFYSECTRRYGSASVWYEFVELFDHFNIAAVIGNSMFCVHGGLSPSIGSIDEIKQFNRFTEIPHQGPYADLMWSDPDPDVTTYQSSQRGCGFMFGRQAVESFLHSNNLAHITRSHQLCMDGFQILFDDKLSTVWRDRKSVV